MRAQKRSGPKLYSVYGGILCIALTCVLCFVCFVEINPCESNPCFHGSCHELNEDEYHCDCTGTFTTGDRCEIGHLEISGPTVLTSGREYSFQVEAMPDVMLSVQVSLPSQNAQENLALKDLFVSPDQITFAAGLRQLGTFNISIGQDGQFDITFLTTTSEQDAFGRTSVFPSFFLYPVIVVPSEATGTGYFHQLRIHNRYLIPSTCKASRSLYSNILCSGDGRRNAIFSSCGWQEAQTGGIVYAYSEPSKLFFPLSATGVSVDQDSQDFSLNILSGTDIDCLECTDLFGLNTVPDEYLLGTAYPYMYGPTVADIKEFVARDSLAFSFVHTVRHSLMPPWIDVSVPNLKQYEPFLPSDVLSLVVSGDALPLLDDCNFVDDYDQDGKYVVLRHNGELALTLVAMTEPTSKETVLLPSLPLNDFYCFAVDLCDSKPAVIMAFPDTAQQTVSTLSILSHIRTLGWVFDISSVSLHNSKSVFLSNTTYWNGVSALYVPPYPEVDVVASGRLSGSFSRENISVTIELSGGLSHEYVTETGQVRNGSFGRKRKGDICITCLNAVVSGPGCHSRGEHLT